MHTRVSEFKDNEVTAPTGMSKNREILFKHVIQKIKSLGALFLFCVAIPTLGAILYFGLIESDVYISESRFVVASPDKPAVTGLGVLLKSAGFRNAGEEVYAARDYILSRDALNALNKNDAFRKAYQAPGISIVDRFDPLGLSGSNEALYRYYQSKVSIAYDSSSGINTLEVRAYKGRDAQEINRTVLSHAETLVNRLNERGRSDLVRFASREVDDALKYARASAVALASFRNSQGIVDPEKQAEVQLQMVSKLQDEIIATRTQLTQLRALAPQNPQIPLLASRAVELQKSINEEMGKVAGGQRSLAASAVQYQRLLLDNEFAEKQLAAAMASLQEARNEARRKQAYVERIVDPSLPDNAEEPRRVRGVIAVFLFGLLVWAILKLLVAGVREHMA